MIKNKGVSMIELVIVIILLIMIAVFAVLSTNTTTLQAEATLIYTEMKSLKKGIQTVSQNYNYGIIDSIDEGVHYNVMSEDGEWYVIYGVSEVEYSPQIIKKLGLEELKRTYLVKFETGEIQLEEPISLGEYKIKTYEDIDTIMESGAI